MNQTDSIASENLAKLMGYTTTNKLKEYTGGFIPIELECDDLLFKMSTALYAFRSGTATIVNTDKIQNYERILCDLGYKLNRYLLDMKSIPVSKHNICQFLQK